MSLAVTAGSLLVIAVIITGLALLYKSAMREESLLLLAGFFALTMGLFLLLVDVVLISLTHGVAFIVDYLLFIRSAGDYGIAGRWIFTGYFFCVSGVLVTIYYYILGRRWKNSKE
jgi:hypothetical protein